MTSEDFALLSGKSPEEVAINSRIKGLTLDITADIPEEIPILKQGEIPMFTIGNFACVSGCAKTRKTFLVSAIVGAFLRDEEYMSLTSTNTTGTVLYIDTEQATGDVLRVAKRIHRIAGLAIENTERLRFLHLRELSPAERKGIVKRAIEIFRPTLCVIDGIADLMTNGVNDLAESVEIATLLMNLSEVYQCHILTVIHTNPDGSKMRGHAGSEIARKAELVLNVTKDGDNSKVESVFSRRREPDPFAFFITRDGLPMETAINNATPKVLRLRELFEKILPLPNTLNYKDLTDKVMREADVKERMAKYKIKEAIEKSIIQLNNSGFYHLPTKEVCQNEISF